MNSAVENSLSVADTAAPGVRSQGLHDMAIWGTTIFLSAFLLFQVQPLLAKIILPWFGGGAGVWITTLVFFQIAYLLGNLYAYWLGAKTKAITNVADANNDGHLGAALSPGNALVRSP